jgi:hypothetical protein
MSRLVLSLGMAAALAAPVLLAPAHAQSETAALLDPFDPVPQIGGPGGPPPPHHPGGHDEHHFFEPGRALMVDCSGTHRGMFRSINAAVDRAPPGGTILILPPGQGGATCVESIEIGKPLTLATYGGGRDAVIEAPQGAPCLTAHIPLGDTLTVDGVRFIARNRNVPCLVIGAGEVAVRNSFIDSRSTEWAFDIAESVEVEIGDSHIETDGSGIHAFRAHVALSNVDIDIDEGRTGVGMMLERTDGTVDGGSIIGGGTGIRAVSGTRGLRLSGVKINKAATAVSVGAGGLGVTTVSRLVITQGDFGIVVAGMPDNGVTMPEAEADVTDNVIVDVRHAGIVMGPGAHVRAIGNAIYARGPAECVVGGPTGPNICHKDPKPEGTPFWWHLLPFGLGALLGSIL